MNEKPIRVLQCVSNMDRAGIETMLMNYYRNIDRNKVQFDFLCNKSKPGDYNSEILELGGKIYVSPGLNPFKWFKYQKYMKKLFENNPEYKIIHCQNEAMGFYALKAAKDNNIPIRIAHSHNTTIRFDMKFLIKFFCKMKLKSVSNIQVACGREAGKFLFNDDVRVIKNAIDTEKFIYNKSIREKMRRKYKVEDKLVIGHVGRFEPQKNHKFLIEVFKEVANKRKDAVLVLVGDGSLRDKNSLTIKKYGLENRVIFTGNISNVNEMYQMFDIFVLPSLHEGLPVVGVEAQASDLKCLFSDRITDEAKIMIETEYLKLSKELWADRIIKYLPRERNNNYSLIEKNGFDIKKETEILMDWYIELYNKGSVQKNYDTE